MRNARHEVVPTSRNDGIKSKITLLSVIARKPQVFVAIYNLANRNLCNGIFNEVPYYGLLHFVRNDEAGENANAFARHKILQISRKQWLGFRHY